MNDLNIARKSFLLGAVWCFLVGCGGEQGQVPVAPTSGVVTYQGQPVEDAEVVFVPEGISRIASGRTNSKGEFSMTTYDTGDGAVVASNKVVVAKQLSQSHSETGTPKIGTDEATGKQAMADYQKIMIDAPRNAKVKTSPSSIPQKYSDPAKTPLKFSVVKGEKNHFKIELKD